jgi:hypothetical protein
MTSYISPITLCKSGHTLITDDGENFIIHGNKRIAGLVLLECMIRRHGELLEYSGPYDGYQSFRFGPIDILFKNDKIAAIISNFSETSNYNKYKSDVLELIQILKKLMDLKAFF